MSDGFVIEVPQSLAELKAIRDILAKKKQSTQYVDELIVGIEAGNIKCKTD